MKFHKFSIVTISLLTSLSFIGCGSSDSTDDSESETSTKEISTDKTYSVQPYLRVAELDGNWDSVPEVAEKIAKYIHETDESTSLNFPTNWIIAGAETDLETEKDILNIPLQDGNITRNIKMIELCNKKYAIMAVETGNFHSSALPCQVSVHSENGKILVDILNPEAIFSLFFYDLSKSEKTALKTVALDVKREIKEMIYSGLESNFTKTEIGMGSKYNESQFENLHKKSPFKVDNYTSQNKEFSKADLTLIANKIIEKLGNKDNPSNVQGLSDGSLWHSVREVGVPIPNSQVIEAISPKYAKMITAFGVEYATVLPFELSVTRKNGDNKTLQISYLNPEYMLKVMLGESVVTNELIGLSKIISDDLSKIVDEAIKELKNEGTMTLSQKIPENTQVPTPPANMTEIQ